MEFVFRQVEYWIDGDFKHQRKLKEGPWTKEKIFKRLLKHSIFILIAVVTANIFLAYIIGIDELKNIVTDPIQTHLGGFIAMILFSGAFYMVFSLLRVQVLENQSCFMM